MKEIESKLKQMIDQLERSMVLTDSINQKLETLLEAITKTSPQPKEKKGVGGLKWVKEKQ